MGDLFREFLSSKIPLPFYGIVARHLLGIFYKVYPPRHDKLKSQGHVASVTCMTIICMKLQNMRVTNVIPDELEKKNIDSMIFCNVS